MDIPSSLPVKDLLITHPDYAPGRQELFTALYEGGPQFERCKHKILRMRQSEMNTSAGAFDQRRARLEAAPYIPHVRGIINWLASAVMQSEPSFLARGGLDKTAYYHALNHSADGRRDLPALIRIVLLEAMVQGRSYMTIYKPDAEDLAEEIEYANLGQQRDAGELDLRLGYLCAKDVDDWLKDSDENLEWVRVHTVDRIRSKPYGRPDIERHTWTFIDDKEIRPYVAIRELRENNEPMAWEEEAVAVAEPVVQHGMRSLPVIEVDLPSGLHIMHSLSDTAIAIFNREAALQWALDMSAFAMPVVQTNLDLKGVVASEMSCIKLQPGDTFKFESPNPQHFAPMAENIEQLKNSLFLAVQAMVLSAAAKTQSPRQPAESKKHDLNSIYILLSAFASALRDGLEQAAQMIRDFRQDSDVEVDIAGLDAFSISSSAEKIAVAQEFLSIPNVPWAAKKWVLTDISLSVSEDAPAQTREEIRNEIEEMEEPDEVVPPSEGNPSGPSTEDPLPSDGGDEEDQTETEKE